MMVCLKEVCCLPKQAGRIHPVNVKDVCINLLWFNFILHLEYHTEIGFKLKCKLVVVIKGFSWIVSIALLSA